MTAGNRGLEAEREFRTADFDYDLPRDRIAQRPAPRGTSRLLVLDRASDGVGHANIGDLPDLLSAGDLMVVNDTRVIPARMFATRPGGRRFELVLLHAVAAADWEALLRPAARARAGERLELADGGAVMPVDRLDGGRWLLRFDPPALDAARLEAIGSTPLPPYIERPEGPLPADREDYQTVYAAVPGAVAAPTAGLHFTTALLDRIAERGVDRVSLTLHVGLGTFQPVTADSPSGHRMHREWYRLPAASAERVNRALDAGRRLVCVGTTTVRALEGALIAGGGRLRGGEGWTDLFITPGHRFQGVGALLTNFHLPRSTLLMLVAAFAGRERVLAAYAEAVRTGYRFYSYGDAMLIL